MDDKTSDSFSIDEITMNIMCNKKIYNKILSKNNPEKFDELQKYHSKIQLYSDDILHIVKSYLIEPNKQITNDLDNSMHSFLRTCIRYFEMKEMENSSEDEMLFQTDKMNDTSYDTTYLKEERKSETTSLWGIKVNKVDSYMVNLSPWKKK
jgi:hypothetical protein